MKVVINDQFGGFSLSAHAVAELAKLQNRPCYFFIKKDLINGAYLSITLDQIKDRFFYAFDIPNPSEVLESGKEWGEMSSDERKASNDLYSKHSLDQRPENRACPLLVNVVEKLGEKANGSCASLKVVEIPDDVEWEIDEYDGSEHVAEKHRIWR